MFFHAEGWRDGRIYGQNDTKPTVTLRNFANASKVNTKSELNNLLPEVNQKSRRTGRGRAIKGWTNGIRSRVSGVRVEL